MEQKKIGVLILGISVLLGLIFVGYNAKLNNVSALESCNPTAYCAKVSSLLSLTNFFIGIISALLSLGFYLIAFNQEEKLVQSFAQEKKALKEEEKFNILMKALHPEEQQIMKAVQQEQGITQSMLRIKTDYSKTKLSLILKDLEGKKLIKKEIAGKTNKVYII
ncbi:hypothetical protein HZB00_02045 [Candidatus Woesearchaeota archaeon]|nr:hypothetical protein [Candidatus Woesearchaeota archaeon]